MKIESEKDLIERIENSYLHYDAIVVEGYDGVGKGRVLTLLSILLGVKPYRPDYTFWNNHNHRYADRWKVSGFFLDVYSHFGMHPEHPMLFDRGVMSGAVYGHDDSIARDYKKMLRDMKVLHILVQCTEEDFLEFQRIRNDTLSSKDHADMYDIYKEFTDNYVSAFAKADVEYLVYVNHINRKETDKLSCTCGGCGHYSYGKCMNPSIGGEVSPDHTRCEYSSEEEVQDRDVNEMHLV